MLTTLGAARVATAVQADDPIAPAPPEASDVAEPLEVDELLDAELLVCAPFEVIVDRGAPSRVHAASPPVRTMPER
jgi:hypothetical protein